jgi:GH25 family lysozyme M1 (1,4-beta-N-acetylmuramidase)
MPVEAPHLILDTGPSQGLPDWSLVAANVPKVDAAWVKLSEGAAGPGSVTTNGIANVKAARVVGIPVRGYHFYSPFSEPEAQADNFLRQLHIADDGWDGPMLVPMVDVERSVGSQGKFPTVGALLKFLALVEQDVGEPPILYSAAWVSAGMGMAAHQELTRYRLWVASYSSLAPAVCKPWGAWGEDPQVVGWQFTGHGRVAGVGASVDLSRFREIPIACHGGAAS